MKLYSVIILFIMSIAVPAVAGEEGGSDWGYRGNSGPGNWANLSAQYATCMNGRMQSPVNIDEGLAIEAKLVPLEFNYQTIPLVIENNGRSVQLTVPQGNSFKAEKHKFDLIQFHYHAPSEYHLNGKSFKMELHLVHKRDDGALAVISVLFEKGNKNSELEKIFTHLPQAPGDAVLFDNVSIDLNKLLPQNKNYYRLAGSLTTPPCSEQVSWFIMEHPLTASYEQIQAFTKLFPGGNNRPLQPVNNRLIIRDID